MPETRNPIIVETLLEALETMAFVMLSPLEDAAPAQVDARLVRIEFHRPEPGMLELAAPCALGRLLSANILGLEPDDAQAVAGGDDALRELVNVTCGTLLMKHSAGSQRPFEMGLPQASAMTAEQWQQFIARDDVDVLDADGHTVAIAVSGLE